MSPHSATITPRPRRRSAGYSLVEVTLATAVLAAGVAAAASLTMTSARIEEMNHRKARVLALTEAAARLWQLGLSPSQAVQLIPGDPAVASISFNADPSDPGSWVPSNQGAAVADPANDLGSFETVTIRASVTLRDRSGPTAGDGLSLPYQPLRVVR
jgi:type II secretory pathway pseudopilin PulG